MQWEVQCEQEVPRGQQSVYTSTWELTFRFKALCGFPGGRRAGEGWMGSLGLADANYYI